MIPILNSLAGSRRHVKLPCFMMETFIRNPQFYGREEVLQQLDSALLPSRDVLPSSETGQVKHFALCGMAGLGKTEIAIEFAFSRRDNFDAVFWVRADEEAKLEFDFSQIAVSLGLEDPADPQNQALNRDLARGWLANPRKSFDKKSDTVGLAKWLIILDNADRPDILNNFKSMFGTGSFLITCRDPLAKTTFPATPMGMDLLHFQDQEATQFLLKLVSNGSEAEAHEIAQKLGCLPLALSQMAEVIRGQYLGYAEFLKMYQDATAHGELHDLEMGPRRETARGTISSIWAIEKLPGGVRALSEVLAFLDPDCIQERIFTDNPSGDVSLPDYPQKTAEWTAARGELLRASLLRRNAEKKELWMHRLLQDSVRAKMSAQRQSEVFSSAITLISIAWPAVSLDKRHGMHRWQNCEELYPHILSLKRYHEQHNDDKPRKAMMQLAHLLNEAGWWQHERGNSHHIKSFLNLAQTICEKYQDTEEPDLLSDIHYALGAVANETNDAESCLTHTGALLGIRLQVLRENGKPNIRLAVAYNERGVAWMMNSAYENALESFQKSIAVYESLEDFWKGMISLPLANLGLAYWLLGNLASAEAALLRALRDREELFGAKDDSFRMGRILHGLGNVRYSQGMLADSADCHQKALSQYQSTIGNNHHRTADVCHRVAQHCLRDDDIVSARALIDQALKVWGANRAIYIPELARTTFLKGKVVLRQGDEQGASDLFKEAVCLRGQIPNAQPKPERDLLESDFDELVTFWSR